MILEKASKKLYKMYKWLWDLLSRKRNRRKRTFANKKSPRRGFSPCIFKGGWLRCV